MFACKLFASIQQKQKSSDFSNKKAVCAALKVRQNQIIAFHSLVSVKTPQTIHFQNLFPKSFGKRVSCIRRFWQHLLFVLASAVALFVADEQEEEASAAAFRLVLTCLFLRS